MDDKEIEQEIQAKGLTAPRVTPDDIKANINSEVYFTAADGVDGADIKAIRCNTPHEAVTFQPYAADEQQQPPLSLLTFCVLTMNNGFTVTGESACASPENFDAETGRKIARQNAIEKIWPLMGYALKEQLFKEKV